MIVSVGRMMRKGGGGLIWPKGLKESIKAIYDPKKQGLTNYDVIEAYTEDFKKWNNSPEKYTGSLTSNSLALTNVSQKTALIYSPIKPYDFKVLITGLQEGQHIKFGFDYGETILEADKDGVYTLEWKEGLKSYGIYTNFLGDCNITITQLPTSILKDLSGNGNHAYLYGGKGKLNSGMGVYKFDFLSDLLINSAYLPYTERQYDSICSLAGHPNGWLFQYKSLTDIPTFKIEVKGIVNDKFHYRWYDENGNRGVDFVIDKDGIYEFPMSYSVETNTGVGIVCNNICQDNVCFTQIPDYPNQLCYDGKMYAVCYDFPILTDYTVMADRTWFDNEGNRVFIIWPNCAFNFEKVNASLSSETFSYSQSTNIDDLIGKSGITYQTKQSYNGKVIGVGTSSDGDILLIGGQLKGEYVGCHGKIIIADRSFTEDEITWLKDNLFRK